MLRLADDVTLVAESVDGIVERGGVEVLRLDGQALALAKLASFACVPCKEDLLHKVLLEVDPIGGEGLFARLCEASVLIPCELTTRLMELHAATFGYDARTGEDPAGEWQMIMEDSGRPGIDLPEPQSLAGSLERALALRRTPRGFSRHTLTQDELATLLGFSARAMLPRAPGLPAAGRPYPSGGALFGIDMLLYPLTVSGVPPAFYHYQAFVHRLARVNEPLPPEKLRWLFNNHPIEEASLAIFLAADLARSGLSRYGGKAYRLMLLEAGHLAQNLLLVTSVLGLAGLPLCGFRDTDLTLAAGLPHTKPIIYALVLGKAGEHVS